MVSIANSNELEGEVITMVFDHFPPNLLTETIVTVEKATTIRLFAAKSQGWGVGSVYSEKPSGRWGVWPHSVFQLDTYQLSKRPHGQKTYFKGFWLVTTCAASTHRITPEFMAVDHNEGSIQGGVFKICGSFHRGRLSKWLSLLLFCGWEPGMA